MISRCMVLAMVLLGLQSAVAAPPVVDDTARFQAQQIAMMGDTDPTSRMLMLLAARDLNDAALFALASTHPGLVEQLIDERYLAVIDYIAQLPPGELYRIRGGETVVRTPSSMTNSERARLDKMIEAMGFSPKRFQALRIGPLEGRVYRFEITVLGRRRRPTSESVEMCWPATPERDEASRVTLSRHFGARPSQSGYGTGAAIPLLAGSFEGDSVLGSAWSVERGLVLGLEFPTNDIELDNEVSIDGLQSLRFHGSEETRHFQVVSQQVAIQPGTPVRVRAQLKADNLRQEFQQEANSVYMQVSFLDASGFPVGAALKDTARLETHPWEPLTIEATAPDAATTLRLELVSGLSGTAWFDGVSIEVR